MAVKQPKAIQKLYNAVLDDGLVMNEDEDISEILTQCEKKGQFLFHEDSYWSFIKTTTQKKDCIRMIFAFKNSEGSKVKIIGKITSLVSDLEDLFIYVDEIKVSESEKFTYLDAIKVLK